MTEHPSTTTAKSGETVYLGDLVKVSGGFIMRRATREDLGLRAGEQVIHMRRPPPDDIHVWNGGEAVPFQEWAGLAYPIEAEAVPFQEAMSGTYEIGTAPFKSAAVQFIDPSQGAVLKLAPGERRTIIFGKPSLEVYDPEGAFGGPIDNMTDKGTPETVSLPRYLNAFPDEENEANALRNLILEAAYVRVLEKASTKMIAPHGSWSWIVEAMEAAYNRVRTMSDAEVLAASDSIQADWDRAVGNS